jgi:serine/threonine protein kinase
MPAIEKGTLYNDHGGYSDIYKGQRSIYKPHGDLSGTVHMIRAVEFQEVCIKEIGLCVESSDEKEYLEEINAILYEAYLHALIDETLERNGLGGSVPRLFEVLATTSTGAPLTSPTQVESIWMTMELISGETLEKYLQRKFLPGKITANTRLLYEVLVQLSYILQVLQSTLLFNHRDLKINNVYVRHHEPGWKKRVDIPEFGTFETELDLVMIDFGFSCISCGSGFLNPRATLLGAGSFFPAEDDCLKKGRDLAQFLYSLQCTYSLQSFVSPTFFEILHRAMNAERRGAIIGTRTVDLYMGLDAIGTPMTSARLPACIKYNDGIYLFLRDPAVEVPGCEPCALLRALKGFPLPR